MAPFDIGRTVEVSPDIPEMRDVYFIAQIIYVQSRNSFIVRYEHVFGENGEELVHKVQKFAMRPLPPVVMAVPAIGDEVDIPLIQGWWRSTVTQVTETTVVVKLYHYDVYGEFDIGTIRMHQEWNRRNPSFWRYMKMDN